MPWFPRTCNAVYTQLSPTAPFQPVPPAAITVPTPLLWDLPFHQALVASWGPGKEVSSSDTDPRSIAEDYWVHQQSCWHLQVCTLEEGQEKPDQREKETKGVRSSRGNTKISRGGKAPFRSRHPHCSPLRTMPGQMKLQPVESQHWSRGKPWGRNSNSREELLCADNPLFPFMVL